MTAGQFADIVAEMRAAQKCYFRTRSQKRHSRQKRGNAKRKTAESVRGVKSMKIKTMIFTTFKLIAAFIPAIIVIILLIPIRIAQFLWHFFKMAYLFLWIRNRKRKMPLIIINNNGLDLEKIEKMQNEKDESQRRAESGE